MDRQNSADVFCKTSKTDTHGSVKSVSQLDRFSAPKLACYTPPKAERGLLLLFDVQFCSVSPSDDFHPYNRKKKVISIELPVGEIVKQTTNSYILYDVQKLLL